MFRSLLTPFRGRFDQPPALAADTSLASVDSTGDESLAPEDFARDVLIELMRNAVDSLKAADNIHAQTDILVEIQRIMLQDSCVKDVFRELDGFLVLMSVLSTVQTTYGNKDTESVGDIVPQVLETTRLVFMIVSEAMFDCSENADYFTDRVGYDYLFEAVRTLVSDPRTADQTVGFIFSLALHDFSVSGIFTTMRGVEDDQLENTITEFGSRLGVIRRPGAISPLWNLLPQLTDGDLTLRYGCYKLFELLSYLNHRNHAVLSNMGLVETLFNLYYNSREDQSVSEKERHVWQKLLRRLLDMGANSAESRFLFQRSVKIDDTLDADVVDIVRTAMRSRWPEHFSMDSGAALVMKEQGIKGLPVTGFTFMAWLWFETFPATSHTIFCFRLSSLPVITLSIRSDGRLELQSSGNRDVALFAKSTISRLRWVHITIVHYPHRVSNPTIRLFIDGVLNDTLNWQYPKSETSPQHGTYVIGNDLDKKSSMKWCLASSHFFSVPFSDDFPRLIHHLSPRYCGNFQDPFLIRFLTYEASTSLNMFLSAISGKGSTPVDMSPLMKAVRDGLGISETSMIFSISPASYHTHESNPPPPMPVTPKTPFTSSPSRVTTARTSDRTQFTIQGDVFVVRARCLDMALWNIGGAAVPLRLVQLASSPHELSRAIGILTDGLRNSWQNSEDMERLRGYEILGDILRTKCQMINMTSFETLFEFLGLNFRSPDHSTVVNTVAYRAIALDFDLWCRTRKDIQRVHLEHFVTLLQSSRHKKFNTRQRFAKLGIVRKLLFVLQTEWYQHDTIPFVIDALKVASEALFSADDAIKPIVSYLAANLYEDSGLADSPRSVTSLLSRIDHKHPREKAEQVLISLVSILTSPISYNKFTATLPLARICLLLLGDRPTPVIASQILLLIGISLNASQSFSRKFELVSGWSALKSALPAAWSSSVHEASFDILLGRVGTNKNVTSTKLDVVCPHIMPAILAALRKGLLAIAEATDDATECDESSQQLSSASMEALIEELMDLHGSSSSFRQVFKSQQTTQLFVDAYKSFVSAVTSANETSITATRILEKLTHFGLSLALDNCVSGSQKREILDILQSAQTILNPASDEKTTIDPTLVTDGRSIRTRIASSRISIQLGERTLHKSLMRMHEWRETIITSERKRLRKTILDLRENRRQVAHLYGWTIILKSERGLWVHPQRHQLWRLDETEGPHRIRKKLEPENEKSLGSRMDDNETIRNVEPDSEVQSLVQVEIPPWAESYEISATEVDEDRQLAEDISEDKHRRVRHELEPGDVIEAVGTVARIAGVDSSPGLLIFGRSHLYMLDGLVENDDGEVIDAHDAPKRLFFVPGSIVELDGPQKAQRWTYDQVASFSDRTFLFRDVALELYFRDSRSLLIVFLDKQRRRDMNERLTTMIARDSAESLTPGLLRTPLFGKVSAKVVMGFRADELSTAQRKWQAREISNFTYLTIINQISGRTPSDATQYPIFPWVLKDYESKTLDLNVPEQFRDLTKPMGALTPARCEAAQMRYSNLESVGESPFHYGTHFSSSMIVCHFLMRLSPFTHMFKTLQGGDWDLPDRLFSDVSRAYHSASQDVRGDVRELIPEFFNCPEFLENSANIDFGVQQNNGERIHDVKLPPWALQDPLLFITMNRKALESQYVSENLPAWIDLIWGCKQRDPDSLNVFHPLSYEGSIDLDMITDEMEREATVGIIHNFGQTPRKIFSVPHPPRFMQGVHDLPLGTYHGIAEDAHLLLQGSRVVKDLGSNIAVRDLVIDMVSDRVIPCPEGVLHNPYRAHEQLEWGPKAGVGELRVLVDRKVMQVIEATFCTCAIFADHINLITGSSDHIVRLWRVTRGSHSRDSISLVLSHIMRVHTDEVICVTASRPWSLVVSGSKDGSAALWDLNRGVYVRSIWHGEGGESAVHLVAVNENTGNIATCSRTKLCLHTINARSIVTLDLLSPASPFPPSIVSLAFHEREYSHQGVLATGGSDGTITLRSWNTDNTPEGSKAQWEFVTLRSMKIRTLDGQGDSRAPCVTALRFIGESLCHGEETGKTYMWSLPD